MSCNHDCEQGDTCDCDYGEPFTGSTFDVVLAVVVFVFALSSLAYLFGGW